MFGWSFLPVPVTWPYLGPASFCYPPLYYGQPVLPPTMYPHMATFQPYVPTTAPPAVPVVPPVAGPAPSAAPATVAPAAAAAPVGNTTTAHNIVIDGSLLRILNILARSQTADMDDEEDDVFEDDEVEEYIALFDLREHTTVHVYDAATNPSYENKCSVCCSEYAQHDIVRVLRCKHAFHMTCIDQALETTITCPLCRTPVIPPDDDDTDDDTDDDDDTNDDDDDDSESTATSSTAGT